MKPFTLRRKIAVWSAGVTGATLLVFAIGTLISVYLEQIESLDLDLREDAIEAKAALAAGLTLADLMDEPPSKAFAIIGADGTIRQASHNFPGAENFAQADDGQPRTVRFQDQSWRVISFPWHADRLWVAGHLSEVRETLFELVMAYLVALPFAAGLAAWGGGFVASRALIPVREAARAAETIGGQDLARRLPRPLVDDEIGHLTTVLNRMLERIERSYRQAERFSADASHELRTPLTIIRGEIDSLMQQPALPPNLEHKLMSLREEIDRLDRITEHLLLLAKFDAGRITVSGQTVDFSALVIEACEDIELLTSAEKLGFVWVITPNLSVRGDLLLLRRLVLNLLDNAVKHNRSAGNLRCELQPTNGHIALTVTNTGPTIPSADRKRVFERFFHSNLTGSARGHGLGLSLCLEIARAHQATLALASEQVDDTTTFVAVFPQLET